MPAVSEKQQQFFGAELRRKREGKKTRTKLSEAEIEKFASTKHKDLPVRKRPTGSGTFTVTEIQHGFRRL